MLSSLPRAACLLLCGVAAAFAARADSLVSSASSAGSASLGSASESITGSSRSSSPDTQTADGDYRVIEVAQAPGRADLLQLTLQALDAPERGFVLRVPRAALAPRGIAPGELIELRRREYGWQFARVPEGTAARQPFFLALHDDWRRELDARAVAR